MLKVQPKLEPKKKEPKKPLDLTPITSKLEQNLQSLVAIDKRVNSVLAILQETLKEVKGNKPDNSVDKFSKTNILLTEILKEQQQAVEVIKQSNLNLANAILQSKDSKTVEQLLASIQKQMVLTNNLLLAAGKKEEVKPTTQWNFKVNRDSEGSITDVIATAK